MDILNFWENQQDLAWFLAALAMIAAAGLLFLQDRPGVLGCGVLRRMLAVGLVAVAAAAGWRMVGATTWDGMGARAMWQVGLVVTLGLGWRLTRAAGGGGRAGQFIQVALVLGSAEIAGAVFPQAACWWWLLAGWGVATMLWVHLGAARRSSVFAGPPWLTVTGVLAILLAGIAYIDWNDRRTRDRLQREYLRRVQTAVLALDAAAVRSLQIDPGDLGSAGFARVQEQLDGLLRVNPDLAYVYLWTLREGRIVYVAEGTAPGRGEVALPGEVYREANAMDAHLFARHEPFLAGPFRDQWGVFVSANALLEPLAQESNRCWLGFDLAGREWEEARSGSRHLGMAVTTLTAALFVGGLRYRGKRNEAEESRRARLLAEAMAATRSEFLAKVSHELRTPLQSILGYSELLQRDSPEEPARSRAAALRHEAAGMLRLVEDLLDLAALECGGFRFRTGPLPLGPTLRRAVEGLRTQAAGKGLGLTCLIDPAAPEWILGDATRLRQMLSNLVGNAIKYTERGAVAVRVDWVSIAGVMGRLEISVRDTGPGIPEAARSKLFQAFSRLDPADFREGAGLGLALVAALCRSAGGAVELASTGPEGTCFRILLPCLTTCSPHGVEPAAPRTPGLPGIRVLVADDSPLIRELFCTYLGELGARCETAADGNLAATLALAGNHDALVLDLGMPGLDGVEVAQRVRRGARSRPWIIGVSAQASPSERERALDAGMDDFLVKPIELAELGRALGSAPRADGEQGGSDLRIRMEEMFRGLVEAQVMAVEAALAQADWPAVRQAAHALRNSAGVVRDLELYAACGRLEDAAAVGRGEQARLAWEAAGRELGRWRDRS